MNLAKELLQILNESLSAADKRKLINDFKAWSGGFAPYEAEDRINDYIEHSLLTDLDQKDAIAYLKSYKRKIKEGIKIPDEFSGPAATAYKTGHLHGYKKQPKIDAKKQFGEHADAYDDGYMDGGAAHDNQASHTERRSSKDRELAFEAISKKFVKDRLGLKWKHVNSDSENHEFEHETGLKLKIAKHGRDAEMQGSQGMLGKTHTVKLHTVHTAKKDKDYQHYGDVSPYELKTIGNRLTEDVEIPNEHASSVAAKHAYKMGYKHGLNGDAPINTENFLMQEHVKAYESGYEAGKNNQSVKESAELNQVADEISAATPRTANQLEVGDTVEITGDVPFKGEAGKIMGFSKNKHMVTIKLKGGNIQPFHSLDVSEVSAKTAKKADKEAKIDKFYVAFYNKDEKRSWIGLVSKEHGGKWHEEIHKGKPEARWNNTYEAYYTPNDIMVRIHESFGRHIEIEGPFDNAEEAEEFISTNWGKLDEALNKGWQKVSPKSQEKVKYDRKDKRVKTPDGEGVVTAERKEPTFSQMVPYKHVVYVKLDSGETKSFRISEVKFLKNVNEDASEWKAWDILSALSSKHGEPDPESLDHDTLAQYIDLPAANKHADKDYDTSNFLELPISKQKHILNKHPEFLAGDAAKAFRNPKLLDLDESKYMNYADWKQAVLLSHPSHSDKIKFHAKMEGEKTTVFAKIPGQDKIFGMWDDVIETGHVLSENNNE